MQFVKGFHLRIKFAAHIANHNQLPKTQTTLSVQRLKSIKHYRNASTSTLTYVQQALAEEQMVFSSPEHQLKIQIKEPNTPVTLKVVAPVARYAFPRNIYPEMTEQEAEKAYKSMWAKKNYKYEGDPSEWGFLKRGYSMDESSFFLARQTIEHIQNKDFYELHGLVPSFDSWFAMTVLHAWMISVRTRTLEPSVGNQFSNYVFNNIWKDLEYVVLGFGTHPLILSGQTKNYAHKFLGSSVAFDEGLMKGDAMLADAVWRNIFAFSKDVDAVTIRALVHYIRKELSNMDNVPDNDLLHGGYIPWGRPISPLLYSEKKGCNIIT